MSFIKNTSSHNVYLQQDRQGTYNVTLRRVRVTAVFVESNKYSIRVCASTLAIVIRYANHIFSAPYYIFICGLSGCTIFFNIIT